MLYVTDAKKPYHRLPDLNPAPSPAGPTTIPPYQPPIEVAIDPEKIDKTPSRKLSIEDAAVNVGVGSDQTFLSNSYLVLRRQPRRPQGHRPDPVGLVVRRLRADVPRPLQAPAEGHPGLLQRATTSSRRTRTPARSSARATPTSSSAATPSRLSAQSLLPPRGQRRLPVAQVRRLPRLGQHRRRLGHRLHPDAEQLPDVRRQARRRHDRVPGIRPDLRAAGCRSA